MRKQAIGIGSALCLLLFPISTHVTGYNGSLQEKISAVQERSLLLRKQVIRDLMQERQAAWRTLRPSGGSVGALGAHLWQSADEWNRMEEVVRGEQVTSVPASTLEMIEATKAWREAGVKGEGTLIAIVDTGINPKHPDLPAPRDKRAAEQKSGSAQKVISGYNWADRNQVTQDVGESQHGMHVAGIAAANGKVKGVAPEAQLLSQKVFSNYQGEVAGLSESILFAINDSIAKRADVINLSLGSSAGYVDDTSMEQHAIKRAVDHGVIVVAAAGNDGYFGSDKVKAENPDVAMVGSPGLAPDALSVASANATTLAGVSFSVKGVSGVDRAVYLSARPDSGEALNPVQALSRPTGLVYVGKGKKEDYNISVKDKVVLIERGDIPFEEKLRLAKEAGAAGVILYNNQPGPLIMSANESRAIPAVSILKHVGEQIAEQLKRGKKVTVTFDGQYSQNTLPYPIGGTISPFSSWGPTPDLQFKPEITAPGGGILSTVLEGDYAVKSGTSMATPHVAGAMALIKEAYRKQGRNVQGREFVETVKAAVMNTAEPILDPREIDTASTGDKQAAYPYSPRVQGAGLIQIAKAIQTPIIITDAKHKAGVSLGEVGTTATFSLFVDNKFGKKPVTYTIDNPYGVLTDLRRDGVNWLKDVSLDGARLRFSADKMTVAPGQRQEVKVTLTIPETAPRNVFAEGFIRFVPQDAGLPTLRVPFYGFYGNWDEPRVIDPPMWDKDSQEKRTGVKTTWYRDKLNDKWRYRDYLGVTGVDEHGNVVVDPAHIAFSPNGDGHFDIAAPSITFLRNARQVSIDVVDGTGQLVRSLAKDEKVSKFDQSKLGTPYYYTEKEEWSWDGKAYSTEKGEYRTVPDGAYQFVIRARIEGRNADWQTVTLPVRVDTRPPELSASLHGNQLTWSTRDKDVQGYLLYIDGKKAGGPYSATQRGTFVSQPQKNITLVAYDFAGNMTIQPVNGQSDIVPPKVQFPNDLFEQVMVTRNSYVPIRGRIAGEDMLDRVKLAINKQPVKVEEDGTFQTLLHLPEGLNYVTYSATDVYGNNRQFTQRVIVDSTPPQVVLTNDGSEEVLFDPNTRRMLVPLRITYRDTTYKGRISINGQIIASWEEEQLEKPVVKTWTQMVPLVHGENKLLIEGRDEAGNLAPLTVNAYADAYSGSLVLLHGEQRVTYKAKAAPAPSVALKQTTYEGGVGDTVPVQGKVNAQTQVRLQLYYGDQRLTADINDRGEFHLPLALVKEGQEKLTVVAVDALGREVKAQASVWGKPAPDSHKEGAHGR